MPYPHRRPINTMKCENIIINNKLGLHARAAAKLVSLASNYDSEITISKNDLSVNGKSIMGVMMLAAAKGTELRLCADGDDEFDAIVALQCLVNNRFDEES